VPKHPHSRHAVICCEQYFLGRVLIDEFGQNSYSAMSENGTNNSRRGGQACANEPD
jgi:hypothetical protein